MGEISPKGTPNMSCSTNASRSAGESVSSTTSSAGPPPSLGRRGNFFQEVAVMLDRPHERLREPRLAGWAPKAASEKRCAVLFEPDVPVRLPDGTVLRGDLYRPKASGSFPALVSWSNYAKELQNTGIPLPIHEVGVTATIVSRGYCHLIVNAR